MPENIKSIKNLLTKSYGQLSESLDKLSESLDKLSESRDKLSEGHGKSSGSDPIDLILWPPVNVPKY